MRRRRRLAALLALATAVFTAGWLAAPFDTFRAWAENVGWLAVAAVAGAAALAAARDEEGTSRIAWACLGAGSLAWAAGQAYWTWSALSGRDANPFPAWSDVGYLAALPLFAAALVAWPRRPGLRRGVVWDGIVGLATGALVTFEFAVEPILLGWSGDLTDWVSVAYPIAESAVIASVILGLLLNVWVDRGRLLVVAAGLVGLTSADAAFSLAAVAGSESTTLLDPLWTLAFVAIGGAALLPRDWTVGGARAVPPAAFAVAVTGALATVAVADAVETPREAAVGRWASYVIAAMFVAGTWRLLALARDRQRATAELRRTQAELRRAQTARDRFMVQLVNAQEADTRRVADVLHDDVVQQLTALGFRLELEAQLREAPKLREFAADTAAITQSIRKLLVELHPAILESQGLAPAIDVAAEHLRERGTEIRVTPFPHRLPRSSEVLAYRVVQEALAHAARSSRAPLVEVELELREDVLHGRVSDNGWGVAPEDADSLGLLVARERVELVGGRFLLVAKKGTGTIVRFEIPVHTESQALEQVAG